MGKIRDIDKTKEQLLTELISLKKENQELKRLSQNCTTKLKDLQFSNQYLNVLYECAPGFVSTIDNNYTIIDINHKKISLFLSDTLKEKTDFIGKKCYEIFKKRHAPCPECNLPQLFKTGCPQMRRTSSQEDTLINSTHKVFLYPIKDERGNVVAALEITHDISENIRLEKERDYQLRFLQEILDAIPTPVYFKDTAGIYLGGNKAYSQFIGKEKKEFIGKSVYDMFPKKLAMAYEKMDSDLLASEGSQEYEYKIYNGNNMLRNVIFSKAKFSQEDGSIGGLVGVMVDITKRKEAETQLTYLSKFDTLTGVYNRCYFEKEIYLTRDYTNNSVGLIICDIDGLKLINDTLGHTAGDHLLKATVNIIKKCCNRESIIARVGGDEFAVFIPYTSKAQLDCTCKKIKEEVIHYNNLNQHTYLSISLGYSFSNDIHNMQLLYKEADNNMYRTKLHSNKSILGGIITAITQIVNARDFVSHGNANKLKELVTKLAQKIKLSDSQIADLRLFAQFHDIGKIGIPDRILFKPMPLTEEEAMEMKRHTEIGYRISRSIPDFFHLSEWILRHHEWWNGEGYPLGLKQEEIPLECRILSIVDAYDAMTSNRPYRQAMSQKAAITELRNCAGTQFDPKLVELFIGIINKDS